MGSLDLHLNPEQSAFNSFIWAKYYIIYLGEREEIATKIMLNSATPT